MTIDVFLIDPDAIRVQTTADIVNTRHDMRLVGTAGSADASLPSLEVAQPHVILFDLADVSLRDVHLIRRIRSLCPDTRVLAVVAEKTEAYLNHVRWCGADGTLLRPFAPERLHRAVKEIASDGVYHGIGSVRRHPLRQRYRRRPVRHGAGTQESVLP